MLYNQQEIKLNRGREKWGNTERYLSLLLVECPSVNQQLKITKDKSLATFLTVIEVQFSNLILSEKWTED